MKNKKNLGWRWEMITNLDEWKIPDGLVMGLSYFLGGDKKEKRIFDLGCGPGRHVIYFARQGFQVSGSDISEKAVTLTNEWLKEEQLKADIQQGSFTSINQPDDSFDLVIAMNVIYHGTKQDVLKGFSEVFRILKPGGLFYGTLKTKNKDEPFYNNTGVEIIDSQTIILKDGVEAGLPHFFSYKEDLMDFFTGYEIKEIVYCELYNTPQLLESFITDHGPGYFRFLIKKPSITRIS
ncbi:MAG: class I SAM-dependent methyltransferase [Candidatus Hodarchaeales archaeon]